MTDIHSRAKSILEQIESGDYIQDHRDTRDLARALLDAKKELSDTIALANKNFAEWSRQFEERAVRAEKAEAALAAANKRIDGLMEGQLQIQRAAELEVEEYGLLLAENVERRQKAEGELKLVMASYDEGHRRFVAADEAREKAEADAKTFEALCNTYRESGERLEAELAALQGERDSAIDYYFWQREQEKRALEELASLREKHDGLTILFEQLGADRADLAVAHGDLRAKLAAAVEEMRSLGRHGGVAILARHGLADGASTSRPPLSDKAFWAKHHGGECPKCHRAGFPQSRPCAGCGFDLTGALA